MTKRTILVVISGGIGAGNVADKLDQLFWQYKADTKKHLIPAPSDQVDQDYWDTSLFDITQHAITGWNRSPENMFIRPAVKASPDGHGFKISVCSRDYHDRHIAMHCIADHLRERLNIEEEVRVPDPGIPEELFRRGTAKEQAKGGLFEGCEITFFYKAPFNDESLYSLLGQLGVPPTEMGNY